MIKISNLKIEHINGEHMLCATINDENRKLNERIWFKTTDEWSPYFCDDLYDPFVLLVLLPAIQSRQDIEVNGDMSQSLFYHMNATLIHLFSLIHDDRYDGENLNIRIIVKGCLTDYKTSAEAVGCGCSLGVDSLSSIKYHISNDCPQTYRITHLTYFNIGALGRHADEAKEIYDYNINRVKQYAELLGLPLVTLESNSHLLYDPTKLSFDQTHTLRNAAAVLTLRHLFKRYYYASTYPIEKTKLHKAEICYQEDLILPLLSNNIDFIEADANKTRVSKTLYISDDSFAQKNLLVCWHDMAPKSDPVWNMDLSNVTHLNCTRCDKCLRTISTLDVLGKADSFKEIFDLDYWYSVRDNYLFKVLTSTNNTFL